MTEDEEAAMYAKYPPDTPCGVIWARELPCCIEAQERGYRLCEDHEDGDVSV